MKFLIGDDMMQPIPLIRIVALVPAITYLAGEGVPVDRYLRLAKLSAPTPETLESLMPLHQLCDFLSLVAREQGLNDLGFRIDARLAPSRKSAPTPFELDRLTTSRVVDHSSSLFDGNPPIPRWVDHVFGVGILYGIGEGRPRKR